MNITDIMEIIKPIKSENVITNGNLVMGSDHFFYTLRTINFNNNFPPTSFNWNSVVYGIKNNISYELNDNHIWNKMMNNLNKINNIKTNITPIIYNNIHENEYFLECISKKAVDGASKFIIDKYYLYIWNGLLNRNKSDKVDLLIYDDFSSYTFLAEFIIYKKKNIVVHQYIEYFKMAGLK